jgi:crotonobetainyl-CoA:carnitine CoA-transferase CaiB-like acyl-CoA transferase
VQDGRNKQSITLNLRGEHGQTILSDLVRHFDVVVANQRGPTLRRWNLDPESLLEINPQLILAYVTGYGLTGPYSDRGSFDRIAGAYCGLTYVTGYPENPPVRNGFSVIDYMASYLAAFGIATALYHRDVHGGGGQAIDLALYEAGFRATEDALPAFGVEGTIRERLGNKNAKIVPANDYLASDGRSISVHAGTDSLFRKLMQAIGRPELSSDARYSDRAGRIENADRLYAVIADWIAERPAEESGRILVDAGIPCSLVMDVSEIAADAHYRERGTITTVRDEDYGEMPIVAPLPRMSKTPGQVRTLGPALGAHNEEVYGSLLGYDRRHLQELRNQGII